jgi:threonine/homoserine/homoserine lactone efflux protein
MESLIASIMPHAVGAALSPLPIAALIFLLLSKRPHSNSLGFLIGWMLALLINVGVFMFLFDNQPSVGQNKNQISQLLQIGFGLILLVLAIKQWKNRPKLGEEPKMPKWMSTIEDFSPLKSFMIAFMLVTVNAKNTVLDISAGVMIAQKATSLEESLMAILAFTIVASFTIAVPVLVYFIMGEKLNTDLNKLKTWFLYNNATILFVLFLILGVNLISKGLGG